MKQRIGEVEKNSNNDNTTNIFLKNFNCLISIIVKMKINKIDKQEFNEQDQINNKSNVNNQKGNFQFMNNNMNNSMNNNININNIMNNNMSNNMSNNMNNKNYMIRNE